MRRRLVGARNEIWRNLPAYGRAEVCWRREKLLAELWDLRFLSLLPRSKGIALDIGANIGVYSSVLARSFAQVHAFEPNSSVSRRLAVAAPPNVTVWTLAASNAPGTRVLRVPTIGDREVSGLGTIENVQPGSANIGSVVQAISLDSIQLGAVELLKIDVEGHEIAVLEGARQILSSASLRAVLVEAEDRHHPNASYALLEFMRDTEFDGFFAYDGALRRVVDFDASHHQSRVHLTSPRLYANMFLFVRHNARELLEAARVAVSEVAGAARSPQR